MLEQIETSKKLLKYRIILHLNHSMEIQALLNLSFGDHPTLKLFPFNFLTKHVKLYILYILINMKILTLALLFNYSC